MNNFFRISAIVAQKGLHELKVDIFTKKTVIILKQLTVPITCHTICRASDFPFQKKQFSVSKKGKIPFRFRFIIAKIEFDEITIYPKKYSIESKLSLD